MTIARHTIRQSVTIEGTGIHSGAPCRVTLRPATTGGIQFSRPGGRETVPAHVSTADAALSDRRTVIVGPAGERFEQIEHLMAALAAHGITDLAVEQVGPEVPFLDGGSAGYCAALAQTGTAPTGTTVDPLVITRPITLHDGEARLVATPHDGLRLSCFVEFPGTVVGSAGFTLEIDRESFEREAAPARTFALARDIEKLRAAGLARGGNLDNAVIFDDVRFHNERLHFPNEPVRHKIIDLLGDLALVGRPLRGHFWAWRAGHRSHVRLAQLLAKEYPNNRHE